MCEGAAQGWAAGRQGGCCAWSTPSEGDIEEVSEVRSCRVLVAIFSASPMMSDLTLSPLSEFALQSVCSMHFGLGVQLPEPFPGGFEGLLVPSPQ